MPLAITWLGHSSFSVRTPGGKTVLFDPWYTGNPSFVPGAKPSSADLILVSHGHSDHIGDAAATARATGATVVAIWEITSYLTTRGVQHVEPMNKGGTIDVKGLRITMTDARHSSSVDESGLVYLGEHYVMDLLAGLALAEGIWRAAPHLDPAIDAIARTVQRLEPQAS